MSSRIRYKIQPTRMMRQTGVALVDPADHPALALAEEVVQAISTDVEVVVGGVDVHLAMLLDPDHWEDDWRERGVEDAYDFLAGLVEEEA